MKRVEVQDDSGHPDLSFWEAAAEPSSLPTSEIGVEERKRAVRTFKVKNVEPGDEQDTVQGENGEKVEVTGQWRNGLPRKGNVVTFAQCTCCIPGDAGLEQVTDKKNFMIVHSPTAIKATGVVEALSCTRKAVLALKTEQFLQLPSKELVLGEILHEWFEFLAQNRISGVPEVVSRLKEIIRENVIQIHMAKETPERVFKEVVAHMGTLRRFFKALNYMESHSGRTRYSQILQIKGKPDVVLLNRGLETEIELKTGRSLSTGNLAQVIMYGLLQQEEKKYASQKLFHMRSNASIDVELRHNETVGILVKRNRMARDKTVPPIVKKQHCTFCYMKDACSALGRIESASSSGSQGDKNAEPGTHAESESRYHEDLKSLQLDSPQLYRHIWNEIDAEEDLCKDKMYLCHIDSWKQKNVKLFFHEDLLSPNFSQGDFVVLCDDSECVIGRGVIQTHCEGMIEVEMFEDIICPFDGPMYFSKDSSPQYFAGLRSSLLLLFVNEEVKKKWTTQGTGYEDPAKARFGVPSEYRMEFASLNADQKAALNGALGGSAYSLIHGMPGSGKTKVIALLVRILAKTGKTVLVSCYTHLSLQNIQDRIEGDPAVTCYRTGRTKMGEDAKSFEEIEREIRRYNVVLATTRAVFRDPIFAQKKRFDTAIVDEATQQNFLCTVIPCMISDKFVLVGDPLQLHPLAKTQILKLSLFEMLRLRSRVDSLRMQYRMPKCIMDVANAMFYNGQMKCMRKEKGSIHFVDARTAEEAESFLRPLPDNVQILCYYNEQVRRIRDMGRRAETIDRFQGSEAEHVFLVVDSFVASPNLEILVLPQRLNVGITRSRSALTVLGNHEYLKTFEIFQRLFLCL